MLWVGNFFLGVEWELSYYTPILSSISFNPDPITPLPFVFFVMAGIKNGSFRIYGVESFNQMDQIHHFNSSPSNKIRLVY